MSILHSRTFVLAAFSLLAIGELHAVGPRRGGRDATQAGGVTQFRGGLFHRPVAQATTTGNVTEYQSGWSVGPQMSAVTSGNVTTYETRGLFGRRIEVGAANTNGNVTTYTQPGLFGRERAVMTAEQQGGDLVYRDSLGRKVGSATTNSQGGTEYRGPLGRKLYTTAGSPSDPRRDGFVEFYRRQQENAVLVDDILWP